MRKFRIYSSISDDQLQKILQEESLSNPSEFSSGSDYNDITSKEILQNTSARGIQPMKKFP